MTLFLGYKPGKFFLIVKVS